LTAGRSRSYRALVRRYPILRAIPLSFFSRALYRDVGGEWRGIGLVYLLLVVAFGTVLALLPMQAGLSLWVRGEGRMLAERVPTVLIRHRVVEVDRPMPYLLRDPRTNAVIAIVDTTGQITSLDTLKASALLTADRLTLRKSAAETRVFDLKAVDRFAISPAEARRWLSLFSTWAMPILAPVVLGGLFVYRLVQVFAFALIGLLMAGAMKLPLDLAPLMRITAVAMTPALIADAALGLSGHKPPGWGWFWTLIVLAYVTWGVFANRPEADAPAAAQ
jgi:hypothetical protein